jgi:hypothetical protein
MKKIFTILAILLTAAASASGQVAPAATAGPAYLRYSLRYSETSESYNVDSANGRQRAIASGNLEYANGGERLPFTLTYGGGYIWTISGRGDGSGLFQNMTLTQGFIGAKWNAIFTDNVSYLPQSSTVGFTGVPGTGEPIGGSGSTGPSSESVLTIDAPVITNTASGEFSRTLNYATRFSFGGSTELMRYPDGNGLDNNRQMANAQFSRRLNARNSLIGQYSFAQYSYVLSPETFTTETASVGFNRIWNRQITTFASVGPQWTQSSNTAVVPDSTGIAASASISDRLRFGEGSLDYSHGKSNGGGYLLGAEVDAVTAGFSREFEQKWTVGVEGGYRRTSGLINNGETNGKYGGVQTSRHLGRNFSVFASYTALDQSSSLALQTNVLNQLEQIVGFGIGYTPRRTHLFRH